MSRRTRAQNQARFWAERQGAAESPAEVAAIWFDACRMVARQSELAGKPEVWTKLATTLNDFFKSHSE